MYIEWNTPVASACQDVKNVYLTRRMVGLQIVDTAIARKLDYQHVDTRFSWLMEVHLLPVKAF